MKTPAAQGKVPRTFEFIEYSSAKDACFVSNRRTVRSRAARHTGNLSDGVATPRRRYAPSGPLQFDQCVMQKPVTEYSCISISPGLGQDRKPAGGSQQHSTSFSSQSTMETFNLAECFAVQRTDTPEKLRRTPGETSYETPHVGDNLTSVIEPCRALHSTLAHHPVLPMPHHEQEGSRSRTRRLRRPMSASMLQIASDHLLGAGSIDPFRTTPLPWQPFLPALMHHYFTALASDSKPRSEIHWSRTVLRETWWPVVLSNATLFSATMLVAANHQSNQQLVRSPPGPRIWLKTFALQSLRQATRKTSAREIDVTIGAMVTLAGCEFLYGDGTSYHVHMKAAKMFVEQRGGIHSMNPAGPLVRLLYWAGHDLSIFDGTEPYFEHPRDPEWLQFRRRSLPTGPLPFGLAQLESRKLVSGALLDVARVLAPMISDNLATNRPLLQDIEGQLFTWTGAWTNSICPLHSEMDDWVVSQADQCLRLGLLSLTYRIMFRAGMIDTVYAVRRRHIFQALDKLDCEALKGTVWREMAFWTMITTRASAGNFWPRDLELFVSLGKIHGVSEWHELKQLLERFPYSSGLSDVACKATWDRVRPHLEKGGSDPRTISSTSLDGAITRYELPIAYVVLPKFLE